VCKKWNQEKGFGFILPDTPILSSSSGDVFVHSSELIAAEGKARQTEADIPED
jgi:cold shock CspA family protein